MLSIFATSVGEEHPSSLGPSTTRGLGLCGFGLSAWAVFSGFLLSGVLFFITRVKPSSSVSRLLSAAE